MKLQFVIYIKNPIFLSKKSENIFYFIERQVFTGKPYRARRRTTSKSQKKGCFQRPEQK